MATQPSEEGSGLSRYVTPLTAWALAFGSSIGWGAFVMPGTTFLPIAGPLGSVLGIIVGAAAMLIVGVSYHYLMNRYPGSGGAFTYAKKIFGYDHGFLCAWFLSLTYVAIVWANATALPLIGRSLLGGVFQFGFSYEIAGFQVYFGEVLLAMLALLVAGFACLRCKIAGMVQIVMAFMLAVGIVVCFVGVGQTCPMAQALADPGPLDSAAMSLGFLNVVALAPWAFVGFESISHSSGEFRFSAKKSLSIMVIAVVSAAIGYGLLMIIAASAQPAGYDGWGPYIADLGNLSGTESQPTFYVIQSCMGGTGSLIIGLAALGGIMTGLIGNLVAASRLLYSMATDGLLPESFTRINKQGAPANIIIAIVCVSFLIPWIGRAATSWIVDVTTVGATIAYTYTSAAAFKTARESGENVYKVFGALGIGASVLFMMFFLVPNLLEINTLSAESYLILASWSVLGFIFFRQFFKHDTKRRMGHSVVAWIVLLSLILFTSLVWVRQSSDNATREAALELQQTYTEIAQSHDPEGFAAYEGEVDAAIATATGKIDDAIWVDNVIQMGLIVIALIFMFDIYRIMQRREQQADIERLVAEESSRAKTSFLSNMSHEIRTPMNAIIGLDNIALKDPDLPPRTREQLEKIGASARHLLGLINDILDMSRIESGRMTLKSEEFAFRDFLDQINVIINGQCEDKGLTYECNIVGQTDGYYVGDDMKLKQVLINILGNAVKFTDAPGQVTFTVEQLSRFEGMCTLRFTMQDTGIGMDADYIPQIFEAFSQEDATATNAYGGSGLGMSITKNLVEMMNGQIDVESEKGVGSTFTVTVTLKVSSRSSQPRDAATLPSGLRVLVVDDDEVACEHAALVLSDIGIEPDTCASPIAALDLVKAAAEREEAYDLVLTDLRMPEMDGIELTRRVRDVAGDRTKVIILTGYSFDDVADEALAAGANGLLGKPLFTDTLLREIQSVMRKGSVGADVSEGATETAEAGQEGRPTDAGVAEYVEGSLAGRRILLAEDIEINAEIMIDVLDMEDISAEHAENGQVALDMFEQSEVGHYDAVLMDVRMPVMDGLTAAAAIRKSPHPDAKRIPIIALTANAFDEDVQRSLQAGMDAHLSKPVDPDRLFETLAKLIAQKSE